MNKVIADDADQLFKLDPLRSDRLKMRSDHPLAEALDGKTVLITGVYGLIGGYIADLLVSLTVRGKIDLKIIGYDTGIAGLRRRVDHLLREPSVAIISSLDSVETFEPDYIFNCAGIASPVFYRRYPMETIEANVIGTKSVLDIADTYGSRLIHFSSSEIYGEPAQVPTSETYCGNVSLFGDRACYDESKRLSEVLCYEMHRLHEVNVTVIRPFNIYGPEQRLDDGRIVPSLMQTALKKAIFQVINGGTATRSYCYIRDAVAQIFWLVINGEAGQVYNIGDETNEVSVVGMVNLMTKINPGFSRFVKEVKSAYVPGPSRRRPDMSKMPIKPQVGLEEGLRRTLESYYDRKQL